MKPYQITTGRSLVYGGMVWRWHIFDGCLRIADSVRHYKRRSDAKRGAARFARRIGAQLEQET